MNKTIIIVFISVVLGSRETDGKQSRSFPDRVVIFRHAPPPAHLSSTSGSGSRIGGLTWPSLPERGEEQTDFFLPMDEMPSEFSR